MKSIEDINAEIERLQDIPAGPNQSMYIRGAVQALVWLTYNAIPPSNIFEVVLSDPRSPK